MVFESLTLHNACFRLKQLLMEPVLLDSTGMACLDTTLNTADTTFSYA